MLSFKEFKEQSQGVYVGAKFSHESIVNLLRLQDALGLVEPTPADKMHVTVLFSRKNIPVSLESYKFKALPVEIETWKSSSGKKNVVVLKLQCPELTKRHNDLIAQGGTHDFPDYQVHVTLSYNHDKEIKLPVAFDHLIIQDEYTEPLDLDWS